MLCEKCNVTGFVSYWENQSPLGSGMVWDEEIITLCECTENDQCPSCGMFWKGQNKKFNTYCDDDGEEFGCIFCLWKSTDLPIFEKESDLLPTPEELIKPYAKRFSYAEVPFI